MYDLNRFLSAQERDYDIALAEIKSGRKRSHWMWYIFPQIAGLGFSETSKFYAIKNLAEAVNYLRHPVLGQRLIEISTALVKLEDDDATRIFGSPDNLKLKSSMTLFGALPDSDPVFAQVLVKYFNGIRDRETLRLLTIANVG
ncbi:DUF1810 domain-containing protein [Mucilaginibacter sp. SD-g]|uniref:DUF1810 domain-containing protein n=2 Tax=Mucilaginibacter segetis TaxID=2793071 RepID=A0A934PQZ9_9SPHI|nr:DUF1810 domain-containing protein [Mucilaginibacter segetis]